MNPKLNFKYVIFITLGAILPGTSGAQFLDEQDLHFIRQECDTVYQFGTESHGNWSGLLGAIKDKRIIALGEFNHGTHEVFEYRNDLIRAIDSAYGVDLILFESGIGEVGLMNIMKDTLPEDELTTAFFGGWRSEEFTDLMLFAVSEDIDIAGYDVQRTGSILEAYLSGNQWSQFSDLEKQFTSIKTRLANYRTQYDSIALETNALINDYQDLLVRNNSGDYFETKALEGRIVYLKYMLGFCRNKDWRERWLSRDSAMAANVLWLLQHFDPDSKVIIIGHNFHLSRYNEEEQVMGEFLEPELGDELYVLGALGNRGSFLNNRGDEKTMSTADTSSLDIKHVIATTGIQCGYINLKDYPVLGDRWIRKPIIINDSFIDLNGSNSLVLKDCFDGILLLDKVNPAIH